MSHPDYKDIGEPEDRIIEECGEILQAVIKGKRFGWSNCNPHESVKNPLNNFKKLEAEIKDINEAFEDFKKKYQKQREEWTP